jgi:hypothetical protein
MPLVTPYLWFARLKSGHTRIGRSRVLTGSDRVVPPVAPTAPYFRPITDLPFYDSRIPRSEWTELSWLNLDGGVSALFAPHSGDPELGLVDVLGSSAHDIRRALHAAARWGGKRGFRKLAVSTLKESAIAGELKRVGFVERELRSSMLLQKTGGEALPQVREWFLFHFALSSW